MVLPRVDMLIQHLFPLSLSSATVPRVLTKHSGRKHTINKYNRRYMSLHIIIKFYLLFSAPFSVFLHYVRSCTSLCQVMRYSRLVESFSQVSGYSCLVCSMCKDLSADSSALGLSSIYSRSIVNPKSVSTSSVVILIYNKETFTFIHTKRLTVSSPLLLVNF